MSGISKMSIEIEDKYGRFWGWTFFYGVIIGALLLGAGIGALIGVYIWRK